eukprot:gnl/MRDRNA2_/MRDRNA2_62055_c0_seq1.p1 gnl/MRDRNA2_/MRDRNA2_62055_c0~~gnl/MRDRNA2_/MRDRNA2_62055_c0_seq1.p1  ORF type:complete len:805 (+),score=170.94 gnl/MRDRNA2_/MRDRNA2_62055_c0_seq1:70-2484(+)
MAPPRGAAARLPLSARSTGLGGGLPKLLESPPSAREDKSALRPLIDGVPQHPADASLQDKRLWNCVQQERVLRDHAAPGPAPPMPKTQNPVRQALGAPSDFVSPTASTGTSKEWGRATVLQMLDKIHQEIEEIGLRDHGPCFERLRVFEAAFAHVIETLPSYRPLLFAVKKEYDGLIESLQRENSAVAPLQGRLQTLKAESISLLGESTTQFQRELKHLKDRLAEFEEQNAKLLEENERLKVAYEERAEAATNHKTQSEEQHRQNFDIVRMFNRTVAQLEESKQKERQAQVQLSRVQRDLKGAEGQMRMLEHQLQQESHKVITMVSGEEAQALQDKIKEQNKHYGELEEKYKAVRRDYESTVALYSKLAGQDLDVGPANVRPLTPRPDWRQCQGCVDPEHKHTFEKAEFVQDLLEHVLVRSRTLLYAYGIWQAGMEKSNVVKNHSKHSLTPAPSTKTVDKDAVDSAGQDVQHEAAEGLQGAGDQQGGERLSAAGESGTKASQPLPGKDEEVEDVFPASTGLNVPANLRHSEPIKNLQLSRKATFDQVMLCVNKRILAGDTNKAFVDSLFEHCPKEMGEGEEQLQYVLSILSAVRRFSAEPDFLAFELLITGKLSDYVVVDNRGITAELLKSFRAIDQSAAKKITKQHFFYALQGLLPNKQKKMWQDLQHYFPAGGPDFHVSYEWLLMDDLYVPSPVIFGLRLQHLEETLELLEKLNTTIYAVAKDGKVKYEDVAHSLGKDPSFYTIQDEDLARGFATPLRETRMDTPQDVEVFLKNLKNGPIFPAIMKESEELTLQSPAVKEET